MIALHPVQYHAPLYRAMSESPDLDVTVLYLKEIGLDTVTDSSGKAKPVIWKQDFLSGYDHKFLKNIDLVKTAGGYFSRINPGLVTSMFSKKYDVVFIQGYVQLSMWITLISAKLSGTKVVWRGEVVARTGQVQSKRRKWLKEKIAKLHIGMANSVMYTCVGNRKFLESIGIPDKKLFPFPCAVDNAFMQENRRKFEPLAEKTREELGIPSDHLVVLYCARFESYKRPLDLLKTLKAVKNPKVTMLFVGDGELRPDLEAYAKEHALNACFVGFIDQTELGRYHTCANVFANMSEYDPSPKALNEAMNFALPVLATNVIGTAEDLVHEGDNGFLVNVGDYAAAAEKIDLLANDRELCAKMGQRSVEIVDTYNFDADVAGLLRACENIFEKG